jgi:FdhD protein
LQKSVAITMRTPGHDEELAAGFLFTEGIIRSLDAIESFKKNKSDQNRVQVILKENIFPELQQASRQFYTTSSCGICGKASIEAIKVPAQFEKGKKEFVVEANLLYGLSGSMTKAQSIFHQTGGLHAAALFSLSGELMMLREDIGRHNAVDKIIGASYLAGTLPLDECILFLSGRAGFELIQKAAMAGIPMVAAVGAPSSLAVEMASEAGITLIGFLRGTRFNIYSGMQRVRIS